MPPRLLLVTRLLLAEGRNLVGVHMNEVDLKHLVRVRHR